MGTSGLVLSNNTLSLVHITLVAGSPDELQAREKLTSRESWYTPWKLILTKSDKSK